MNPSDSDDALIARLLELPAGERAAGWQRLCRERPALPEAFPEIARQFGPATAPVAAPPFSAEAITRAFEAALDPSDRETVGTQIGPYKLIQKIGEGGFGTVWMADQQQPLRRRVALKIVKLGLDTDEVMARFEVERQALALMDHPNIARVFDAGATAGGRPYFVMELVRGVTITRYCDENRLSAAERLRLVVAVCQGVQHAHQKGVIHRDLKPSNLLITLHDGVPVPKIIDFGIAKATGKQLTDKTLVTQFHAFVGTPVYTSPEQMEMSGLDVDTRSDIYSLGVLLYELLAGRPPFDPEVLAKAGLDAMRRTIREVDPPRPSHRLRTLPEADRTSVAHQRGTEVAKLSLLLRGDVDWIVMRCLEKDRTRRYDTAAALAADIQHHLRQEPILARPPSELYRMQKFVRRHRFGVAATAVIAGLIVAGLVTASVLWVRERAAYRRAAAAEAAESALHQEAERARQLEMRRAARTALALAGELLDRGETDHGLAQLVYAARKDPGNPTVAPRLASILTSRNFLLPEGPSVRLPPPVRLLRHLAGGRWIVAGCEDGTVAVINPAGGDVRLLKLPSPMANDGFLGVTGSLVSILGRDHVIRVIDAESAQVAREFRFGRNVTARSPHHAGRPVFVVRLDDDTLRLCEVGTGRSHTLALADRTAWRLSPEGSCLATIPSPHRVAELRDPATGAVRGTVRSDDGTLLGADFSPDGRRLAVVEVRSDGALAVLRVWSVPEGRAFSPSVELPDVHPQQPFSLFHTPDGERLLIWGRTTLELRDARSGALLAPPAAYDASSFSEWHFASDRRFLLTSGGGRNIAKWDLQNFHRPPQMIGLGGGARVAGLSADSRILLGTSHDGLMRSWDLATGRLLAEPVWRQGAAPVCSLSPDGAVVVLATEDGELLQLRLTSAAAQPLRLPWDQRRRGTPFLGGSPAGVLALRSDRAIALEVATGRPRPGGFAYPASSALIPEVNNPSLTRDQRHAIARVAKGGTEAWEVWELGPAGVTRVVPVPGRTAASSYTVADGSGLFLVLGGSELAVWRLASGEPAGPALRFPGLFVSTAHYGPGAFSPDGRRLIAGSQRGEVRVWDIATGEEAIQVPALREAPVVVARFSPDGSRILVANHEGDAGLFEAETGRPAGAVMMHPSRAGGSFSPDGRTLVTWSGRAIHLRDGRSGDPRGEIRETDGIRTVAWSADGTRLVKTTRDGPTRVWDVGTLQPVTDLLSHPEVHVADAWFSPDGCFVAVETFTDTLDSRGAAGSFDLWSIPPALPAGAATPEWLLDLASIIAGQTPDADGKAVRAPISAEAIARIRRMVAAVPDHAPYAVWGRWFLADRRTRSIAPGFAITPGDAAKLAAALAPRPGPPAAAP